MNIDDPRIYADWLEENGYDSELLRVKLALAELGPYRLKFVLPVTSLRDRYTFTVDGISHDLHDRPQPRPGYLGPWIDYKGHPICIGDKVDVEVLHTTLYGLRVSRICDLELKAGPPTSDKFDHARYSFLKARELELSNKITLPEMAISVRRRPFAR